MAPRTPQETPREGAVQEPPLWTLPLDQRAGLRPLPLETRPGAVPSRRYEVRREGHLTLQVEEPGGGSKEGAPQRPLFGRKGNSKGGTRIAPLWRLFWGAWGAIFSAAEKIVPQEGP